MSKLVEFFQTKCLHQWIDPEKKFDRSGKSSYEMTDSVAIAVDFFFSAFHGNLPEAQQDLIDIDPAYFKGWRCEQISSRDIQTNSNHERRRSVFFKSRKDTGIPPFEVELRKYLDQEWEVVGFGFPRQDTGPFYLVFGLNHWFDIREKFDYESC